MMTLYDIKPRFQALLRPLVQYLAKIEITANEVTLTACAISMGAATLIALLHQVRSILLLLPVILVLRMALNAIDGMLAREHNQASRLGGILNEVCDVLSDIALSLTFIPFLSLHGFSAWPVILLTLCAILTEFCGVLGYGFGVGRRYDGPMGKSDRALMLGMGASFLAFFDANHVLIIGFFCVLSALCLWTCVNRVRSILQYDINPEAGAV